MFALTPILSHASITVGTIDTTNKTARFLDSTFGVINLKPTNGGITVQDLTLTGYAWGNIVGWINFDPIGGGVQNDGEGNLSGYAWGEKTGWINFNPAQGGVIISTSGVMSGYAWSQNYGWVVFNCSTDSSCGTFSHYVATDWHPRSVRPVCNNASDDDSDGKIDYPNDLGCSSLEDTDEMDQGGGIVVVVPPPVDVCPNIAGIQVVIPVGSVLDSSGQCTVPVDICPNIVGIQESIPAGMISDAFGNCSLPEAEDVCPNIADVQESIPVGMVVDGFGNCILPEDETDLCPNISDKQPAIPSGMVLDAYGDCVVGPLPPEEKPPLIPPVIDNPVAGVVTNITSSGGIIVRETVTNIVNALPVQYQETAREIVNAVGNAASAVGSTVKEIYDTPTGKAVTQTVTTVGVAGGGFAAASSIFLNPTSYTEFALIPFRLWTLLLSFLGLRKKYRPWGTVYDSITKQPLDPAYVVLYDTNGKEVTSTITDIDGRYGFLVPPGMYKIVANKSNYVFPSTRLVGKSSDELHSNLYFGEDVLLDATTGVIARSIPMDPIKFDWNEFAKRNKSFMKFYSRLDIVVARFTGLMFSAGFVVAIISILAAPKTYNLVILLLYVLLLVLRAVGLKSKSHGNITDTKTGEPLSFAIVRVFSADIDMEISHKVTDTLGRYYCLVPRGKYYIKIEKKNTDETYTPVFTSKVFEIKGGIINSSFKIESSL